MHAEDAIVDDGGKREVIKHISAVSPYIQRAVLPQAFIIKSVDLGDLPALMVTPDQGDQIRIADFICEEQQECLDAVEASIHKIAEEKVADPRDIASIFEEFQEIVKLPMNIATDGYRRIHSLNIALLHQDLSCLGAQVLYLQLADDLAPPQLLDLLIDLTHYQNILKISGNNV